MKSELVALTAVGKEADWLRNLILEIPLWFHDAFRSSLKFIRLLDVDLMMMMIKYEFSLEKWFVIAGRCFRLKP
ncbi:hypothetical protein Tco_0840307 [Tanacetum coccineum]|uniref:Uncharacterized protein n=1 Tax=Tanacetum coccineum TaxID=301880 RepID=A0ABQ5AT52_9ASTR